MKNFGILALLFFLIYSCSAPKSGESATGDETVESTYVEYNNPPAEGFNQEGSDLLATLLADKVMNAMGGRQAWDATKYLSWTFFGNRKHIWDKSTGNVRIEDPARELIVLMNINSMEGKVQKSGEELTQPDSVSKYLDFGKRVWINDSYWLVMPYKLKDSGVTLYYIGEDTTQQGTKSDVIKMTFENVGVTPQNIYNVWIDTDSKLVTQWSYYPDSESADPRFINPWLNYQKYGNIMLSGDRGEIGQLTDIQVLEDVPPSTFESFESITL